MALSSTLSVSVSVLSEGVSDCAAEKTATALVANASRQSATRNAVEADAVVRDCFQAIRKTPRTEVSVLGVCHLISGNNRSGGQLLWVFDRFTPGSAADIRFVPPRVGRVQAIDVAFAFRIRVAILEAPVQQRSRIRILGNGRVPNRPFAVVHDIPGAAACRCLTGTSPGQDAVGVTRGLPVLIARRDIVVVRAQIDDELSCRSVGASEGQRECAADGDRLAGWPPLVNTKL